MPVDPGVAFPMRGKHSDVVEQREDISRFVVHLTRDDTADFTKGGATAEDNLRSILRERRILALRAHCLHAQRLAEVPKALRKSFRVACFTEVPLNQIHLLTGSIPGRRICLEAYGVVFLKSDLIRAAAQPAVYVNSYNGNRTVRDGVDALFQAAVAKKFVGRAWRLLPFVNAMHEKYDFTWEREWRVQGDFSFRASQVVCVILPESGADSIRTKLTERGVACISPGWTYERIVAEMASQQRTTAEALRAAGGKGIVTKSEVSA